MNAYNPHRPRLSFRPQAQTALRSLAPKAFLAAALLACSWLLSPPGSLRAAVPAAEEETVSGNLLLQAKGEVEVYHNGRKIVLRDKSDAKQHFGVKLPQRPFKAGDVIVLRVLSPFVYRSIVAAVNLDGKAGQVPVKKSHWRFLGEGKEATKITAADIQAATSIPASASPDPSGEAERDRLRILPESKGGSEWVKSERQLNGWYCIGFVLTVDMLKTPIK